MTDRIKELTAILEDALKWWSVQPGANMKARIPPWVIEGRAALRKRRGGVEEILDEPPER